MAGSRPEQAVMRNSSSILPGFPIQTTTEYRPGGLTGAEILQKGARIWGVGKLKGMSCLEGRPPREADPFWENGHTNLLWTGQEKSLGGPSVVGCEGERTVLIQCQSKGGHHGSLFSKRTKGKVPGTGCLGTASEARWFRANKAKPHISIAAVINKARKQSVTNRDWGLAQNFCRASCIRSLERPFLNF